jgi:hypothetical protein
MTCWDRTPSKNFWENCAAASAGLVVHIVGRFLDYIKFIAAVFSAKALEFDEQKGLAASPVRHQFALEWGAL